MTTCIQIIIDALQEIGVIDGSEVPEANDSGRGLRFLNNILESWSIENLSVFIQNNYTFNLVPGQATYTIGPDGDFVAPRFTEISNAYCLWQQISFPIEIINNQQYNAIAFKAQSGPIAQFINFNASMPDSRITLWPVPSANNSITILTNQLFQTPYGLYEDLGFPPGYDRALTKVLAVELAPSYRIEPSPTLVALARAAVRTLKRQNHRTPVLLYDAAIPSGYRGWGDGSVAYGPGPLPPVSGGGTLALDNLTLALDGLLLALN